MRCGVCRDEFPSSSYRCRAPARRWRRGAVEERGPKDPPFVRLQPAVTWIPPSRDMDDSSVSLGPCILTLTIGRHNPRGGFLWKLGSKPEARQRPPRVHGDYGVPGHAQFQKPGANFHITRLVRAQAGISDHDAGIA